MVGRILKTLIAGLALILGGGYAFLLIAPPDLLRVGTNYSAKIVCSNVFIAGRDQQEVLAVDVQAPGHPLLKYISVTVNADSRTVEARIFGYVAPARSRYRPGLGCANYHDTPPAPRQIAAATPLPDAPWPRGNKPSVPDMAVQAVLEGAALLGDGWRAVVVVHDGRIVAERYAEGFDETTPLLGWSMTKTVTAGLIGTLIRDGRMAMDDTLTGSFPDWARDDRKDITVADMLAMSSGLEWNEDYGDVSDVTRMLYLSDDMAGFGAARPADKPVGTTFNYSSGTSTMLSRVWQDRIGAAALDYPRLALFGPLGMSSAILETDAADSFVGSSYMYATARDWARYGLLLLQDGQWDGQQVLPEGYAAWMPEAVEVSGGRYGRGHLWRETPSDTPQLGDAVWMRGHDGQSIGIFPSHDMVIVRLGLTPSELAYSSLPLALAVIAALSP